MTALPDDVETPAAGSQDPIERESTLLVDALLAGFGPAVGEPDMHSSPRTDRGEADHGSATDATGRSADDAGPEEHSGGTSARCPGCAVCHLSDLWHSLDPRLLDNISDVAGLFADGLRSAAARLADNRTEHPHREGNPTP